MIVNIEGFYGHSPDLDGYSALLFIAGGSGITHVLSILVAALQSGERRDIKLIWAIQHFGTLFHPRQLDPS